MSPSPAMNSTVKRDLRTAGRCAKTAIKRAIFACEARRGSLLIPGRPVSVGREEAARAVRVESLESVEVPCGRLRGQSSE